MSVCNGTQALTKNEEKQELKWDEASFAETF